MYLYMHVNDCAFMMDGIINLVKARAIYVLSKQANRSRATHVAIIHNMIQDVLT